MTTLYAFAFYYRVNNNATFSIPGHGPVFFFFLILFYRRRISMINDANHLIQCVRIICIYSIDLEVLLDFLI